MSRNNSRGQSFRRRFCGGSRQKYRMNVPANFSLPVVRVGFARFVFFSWDVLAKIKQLSLGRTVVEIRQRENKLPVTGRGKKI